MYVKDAVAKHFDELCRERGICYNELANISGVPPTTVYCMMKPERRKLHIDVIKSSATAWRFPWPNFSQDRFLTNWSRK